MEKKELYEVTYYRARKVLYWQAVGGALILLISVVFRESDGIDILLFGLIGGFFAALIAIVLNFAWVIFEGGSIWWHFWLALISIIPFFSYPVTAFFAGIQALQYKKRPRFSQETERIWRLSFAVLNGLMGLSILYGSLIKQGSLYVMSTDDFFWTIQPANQIYFLGILMSVMCYIWGYQRLVYQSWVASYIYIFMYFGLGWDYAKPFAFLLIWVSLWEFVAHFLGNRAQLFKKISIVYWTVLGLVGHNLITYRLYYALHTPHAANSYPFLIVWVDNMQSAPAVKGYEYDFGTWGDPTSEIQLEGEDAFFTENYALYYGEESYHLDDRGKLAASYAHLQSELDARVNAFTQPVVAQLKRPLINLQWLFDMEHYQRFNE
ncbi:MAG: hypothetical protein Q4B80_01290 [Aerococcaceae bacterium]|nr:hypothetical protein [Aerococcaceae bacterium]